jgi:hypothetical protein
VSASFGPIVSFSLFSFVYFANYYLLLGSIDMEKARDGLEEPAMRAIGPNDGRHVIWAA